MKYHCMYQQIGCGCDLPTYPGVPQAVPNWSISSSDILLRPKSLIIILEPSDWLVNNNYHIF